MHFNHVPPTCVLGRGWEHINLSSLAPSHSEGLQPTREGPLRLPWAMQRVVVTMAVAAHTSTAVTSLHTLTHLIVTSRGGCRRRQP